jgi:hypothetical protein
MTRSGGSIWRRNGLTIVLVSCMVAALAGQFATGRAVHNAERAEQGVAPVGVVEYLRSGHFVSATFENWESEFLQMAMYVLLSVVLRQKGSAESRPLDASDETPRIDPGPTPWPVRAGGVWKTLYGHSLAIAFGALFALSFALHLDGSWRSENAERLLKGEPGVSLASYARGAEFWFESLQNWQSEFLAVAALVVLTIWLRQKDSPQSKPVQAPHSQTGT